MIPSGSRSMRGIKSVSRPTVLIRCCIKRAIFGDPVAICANFTPALSAAESAKLNPEPPRESSNSLNRPARLAKPVPAETLIAAEIKSI